MFKCIKSKISDIREFFIGRRIKGEKLENLGTLTIQRTVVSKDYLASTLVWEKDLYKNIIII